MPSFHATFEYRAALALNNMAVTMMTRGCYDQAFDTFRDAAIAMKRVPLFPRQQEQPQQQDSHTLPLKKKGSWCCCTTTRNNCCCPEKDILLAKLEEAYHRAAQPVVSGIFLQEQKQHKQPHAVGHHLLTNVKLLSNTASASLLFSRNILEFLLVNGGGQSSACIMIRISADSLGFTKGYQDYDACIAIILHNLAVCSLFQVNKLIALDGQLDLADVLLQDTVTILMLCRNLLESLLLESLKDLVSIHQVSFLLSIILNSLGYSLQLSGRSFEADEVAVALQDVSGILATATTNDSDNNCPFDDLDSQQLLLSPSKFAPAA